MNFHRRRLIDEPEINVISMVDLVLVILLFLMVSTTFTSPGILKLNLPTASSTTADSEKARILIDMDAAGQLIINGQSMPLAGLADQLQKISKGDPDQAVYLRADRNSTQQQIVMVLDAARQAGLSRISIGTLKAP